MRNWNSTPLNKQADHVSVSVAPTMTTLAGAFLSAPYNYVFVELTNTDLAQTLNAQLEGSASSGGPWFVIDEITLNAIAAQGTISNQFSCGPFQYVRLRGNASGAGLTATVTVFQIDDRSD